MYTCSITAGNTISRHLCQNQWYILDFIISPEVGRNRYFLDGSDSYMNHLDESIRLNFLINSEVYTFHHEWYHIVVTIELWLELSREPLLLVKADYPTGKCNYTRVGLEAHGAHSLESSLFCHHTVACVDVYYSTWVNTVQHFSHIGLNMSSMRESCSPLSRSHSLHYNLLSPSRFNLTPPNLWTFNLVRAEGTSLVCISIHLKYYRELCEDTSWWIIVIV